MSEIAALDIGGTHARLAIGEVDGGRVVSLGEAITLKTAEHAGLQTAWEAFAAELGRPLPRVTGIAVACPVQGEVLKLTNNPWVIRPALLKEQLGLDQVTLINDFGAIGHALSHFDPDDLRHLCGPEAPLPSEGIVSIIGPGTGLGVAQVYRAPGRPDSVIETEGGHIDFAPTDSIDDAILARLRNRYPRVSAERIIAGPGLADVYETLAAIEGRAVSAPDDRTLWSLALDGDDSLAGAALDRFCLALGTFAGDIALAQGAKAVVIAGGLGLRLADHLPRSGFGQRFAAKGRFERLMAGLPVKLVTHPQPGLLGAAAVAARALR